MLPLILSSHRAVTHPLVSRIPFYTLPNLKQNKNNLNIDKKKWQDRQPAGFA